MQGVCNGVILRFVFFFFWRLNFVRFCFCFCFFVWHVAAVDDYGHAFGWLVASNLFEAFTNSFQFGTLRPPCLLPEVVKWEIHEKHRQICSYSNSLDLVPVFLTAKEKIGRATPRIFESEINLHQNTLKRSDPHTLALRCWDRLHGILLHTSWSTHQSPLDGEKKDLFFLFFFSNRHHIPNGNCG